MSPVSSQFVLFVSSCSWVFWRRGGGGGGAFKIGFFKKKGGGGGGGWERPIKFGCFTENGWYVIVSCTSIPKSLNVFCFFFQRAGLGCLRLYAAQMTLQLPDTVTGFMKTSLYSATASVAQHLFLFCLLLYGNTSMGRVVNCQFVKRCFLKMNLCMDIFFYIAVCLCFCLFVCLFVEEAVC